MNHNTPLSPRPLHHLSDVRRCVLTVRRLREHGVSPAAAADRCRPGGPWQQILPGVVLLHPGRPTNEERLHAALLYAGRPAPARSVPLGSVPLGSAPQPADAVRPVAAFPGPVAAVRGPVAAAQGQPDQPGSSSPGPSVPQQTGPDRAAEAGHPFGEAMFTGAAALTLHGFSCSPPLDALERIDVLVPRTRRLRSTGPVHIIRTQALPSPTEITGLPVAPVPRALADAVAQLADSATVRRLLTEALRGGHCEAGPLVNELSRARLLTRPQVMDAVDTLYAEGRAVAEGHLYDLVRVHDLPVPLWNVDLRLPGGPHLGSADAYWPGHGVALEIDARRPHRDGSSEPEFTRKRENLERLGITLVRTTPRQLRGCPAQQATVVRTALMAADDREPPAYLVACPR